MPLRRKKPIEVALPLEAINNASAREPFQTEPGFGVVSVNYDLRELLARSTGWA